MNLQLTDGELKHLVKQHVNGLIGVPEDRLKVTFTRRSTQTDTSVEILSIGESKNTTMEDPAAQDEPTTSVTVDSVNAILK